MPDRQDAPAPTAWSSKVATAQLETKLARLAVGVADLSGWRRWLTGLTAGAVSILALPPFFIWPVLLATLPVLVWTMARNEPESAEHAALPIWPLDRGRIRHAAAAGWLFGFAFHVAGLYWLREAFLITGGGLGDLWPLGVLGLPAALAIFHALAAAVAALVSRPGLHRVVALAIALSCTEWLRGHILTGFPWNVLGIALTSPMTMMQSSGLVGIYGLTAISVFALASPLVVLASARNKAGIIAPRARAAAYLVVPLATLYAYGTWRLSTPPPAMIDGVRLRLVQPAIAQRDKWRAEKQPEILARHLDLSGRNPLGETDGLTGITHVIWPEAAMPFLPLQRPQVMAAIAEALPDGVHLMTGIVRIERHGPQDPDGYDAYNSMAVIDDAGRAVAVYDKTHLVPFGEYLPFQSLLERIGLQALTRQRGGFASGRNPRAVLDVGALTGIGPLICYEGIFPGIGARSQSRPSVYINITNDGWFGNSTGPRQHMHQARLRAIEEGTSLVRVANNGISAIFDPYGRELQRLGLDVAGVIDTGVPSPVPPPIYGRWGDVAFLVLLVLFNFAFLMVKP